MHAGKTFGVGWNIECNYCYLQTKDPSEFSAGFDPYEVMGPIDSLARQGALDPRLTVDWGGGEPTIYPEFDAVLKFSPSAAR